AFAIRGGPDTLGARAIAKVEPLVRIAPVGLRKRVGRPPEPRRSFAFGDALRDLEIHTSERRPRAIVLGDDCDALFLDSARIVPPPEPGQPFGRLRKDVCAPGTCGRHDEPCGGAHQYADRNDAARSE